MQNSKMYFYVVRFDTVMLFSFDFPSNFLKSFAGYALCFMFVLSCLCVLREVKRVLAFPQIFSFDLDRSIKVLSNKIEKMFL